MSAALQAKLLRVLQDGSFRRVGGTSEERVDVRILAATHRDLIAAVRAKTFREDLYYRLSTFVLRVPPLRERGGDAALLGQQFLADAEGEGRPRGLAPSGAREFLRHDWPGNIRELQQVVARLRVLLPNEVAEVEADHVCFGREGAASFLPDRPVAEMTEGEFLTRLVEDLDELIRRFNQGDPRGLPTAGAGPLLDDYLDPLLKGRAYERTGGNGVRAGPLLGLRGKLDRSKGDWLERYRALAARLPEGRRRGSIEDESPAAGAGDAVAANVEAPPPEEPRQQ